MTQRIAVKNGCSRNDDPEGAVAEIASAFGDEPLACVIFFCSPRYDLDQLAAALRRTFTVPVLGCTSAGQLGPDGFQRGGITAVGIVSAELSIRTYPIRPLSHCQELAPAVAEAVKRDQAHDPPASRSFGLILVDGLVRAEERLAASLYRALAALPIIGGSAGDDLAFSATHVYIDGRFVQDAALLSVFTTTLPFTAFKFQQVVRSQKRLVITAADPEHRIIQEINGEPAASAYADLIGVPLAALSATDFSRHPLVYTVDDEPYVRSIARVNPDLSMTMFCAIEVGLVLSIGTSVDAGAAAEGAFERVRARIGEPELVIGCDCILRRLELERQGIDRRIGELYAQNHVIGFSTYGEQWNGLHMNQTFTGVAIGS